MSCPHHWYEQERAEIAAEIPDLIADLRQVAEERRHDGHGAEAAKFELLIAFFEAAHETIVDPFAPTFSVN